MRGLEGKTSARLTQRNAVKSSTSERLDLNTFSLTPHFGRSNLFVLQVTVADFAHARELVAPRAGDNVYPGLRASDPFSALIESERNKRGIELPITDPLPGAMRATEYRMCPRFERKCHPTKR